VYLYWTGITVAGMAAVYVSYAPRFETPGYEAVRAGVFVAMGACSTLALLLVRSLNAECRCVGMFCVFMVPHLWWLYPLHILQPVRTWRLVCEPCVASSDAPACMTGYSWSADCC